MEFEFMTEDTALPPSMPLPRTMLRKAQHVEQVLAETPKSG